MKKGDFILIGCILIILIIQISSVFGAVKTVCPLNCDYAEIEGCLIGVNNSADTCTVNTSNTDYVLNWSYAAFNFSTPTNTNLIYITASNISVDLNNSILNGNTTGIGVYVHGSSPTPWNITVLGGQLNYFSDGVKIDTSTNVTVANFTVKNSSVRNFHIGNSINNNITLRDSTSLYSGGPGIYINSNAGNTVYILNVNSSYNIDENLGMHQSAGLIEIKNSFFYNSSTDNCVELSARNVTFVNNTIKYCLVNDKSALITSSKAVFYLIENNTIEENSLNMYIQNSNNSVFRGNKLGATYDTDFSGAGFGGSMGFVKDYNDNLIINNTFRNHVDTGLTFTVSAATINGNNSVTQNMFYNTSNGNHLKDIYILNLGAGYPNNLTIWLNHFYGPNGTLMDGALNTDFCVGGDGNFYNESISRHGGYINETDCGLMNITQPDGPNTIINGSYRIYWTKQSAMIDKIINYSIYYRSANSSGFTFLSSTNATNYSWSLASINDSNDYLVRIVPNDGTYNGTNDNSTSTFTIDNNDPSLSLSPSSDFSLDLGGTKDITCSASDNLGIGSTSLTVGGSSFGSCSGSSCSGNYLMGDSGLKTVICSSTDNPGRASSKSIIISFLGGGGAGSGGGGGGGGGIAETITPISTETPIETEQTLGESFNILINEVEYEAKINKINIVSIEANIAGDDIELVIGESKEIDLDDDGTNDIEVTLDGIKGNDVELRIKLKEKPIAEEKPEEITERKVNKFYEEINKLFNNIYNLLKEMYTYLASLF